MLVTALQQTYLKQKTAPADTLEPHQIYLVEKGAEIELRAIAKVETAGHLYCTLKEGHLNGFNSWYLFTPHWQADEGFHPELKETRPVIVAPDNKGTSFWVPGLGTRFTDNPIDGCANFLWGEATANGTRIPESPAISNNIIRIAKQLEVIRVDYNNRPVRINSWFRPRAVNLAIGGASNSTHIQGHAVDFNIDGVGPWEIYRRYDKTWTGGLAAVERGSFRFCHADLRNYRARWSY